MHYLDGNARQDEFAVAHATDNARPASLHDNMVPEKVDAGKRARAFNTINIAVEVAVSP